MPKTPHRSRPIRKLCAIAALLLVLAPLALPADASAGTYAVDACQHPDGSPAGREGWVPFYRGAYTFYDDRCSSAGPLEASWASDVEHNYSDLARWIFTAPPGTTVKGISGVRTSRAATGRDYGTPVTVVKADEEFLEQCGSTFACMDRDGAFSFSTPPSLTVLFGVECGGAPGGRCPLGTTRFSASRLRVTLDDPTAPTFTSEPSGSLTSTTATSRVRTLSYSAKDSGGGVYRQRLLADGQEVASGPVDTNGGRCVRYPAGGGFSSPVPCRTTASGTLSYDTSALADGQHDFTLEVLDATDENKAASSWSARVDNTPPTIKGVGVSGTAKEGDLLLCGSDVDGQSPRLAFRWLRAAADGTGVEDIAGATESSYTLRAGDVGRRVLCRVTATDDGGSVTQTSAADAGPFAGGAVVVGGTAPTGPAAALPACPNAAATLKSRATQLLRSYRRSGVTIAGQIGPVGGGTPLGGVQLDVVQTVTRAGSSRQTKVASVRSDGSGAFTAKVPAGPTRTLQLVLAGCGSVAPRITERVRGAVQASTTTRRIRNKQVARFRGRVLGGYVGRGLPLELQVRVGPTWKDVKAVTSNARGEYRVSYRFLRTFVRYTYRFRVVSRAGSSWPFLTARSAQVRVRVN